MRSVNKVFLLGNLGNDPETRETKTGRAVARFSLATTKQWKDNGGEKQEKTQWHRVVAWGRLAEIVAEYLTKGSQVYVMGEIDYQTWEDQEGQKRYATEIVANELVMLGGKGGGSSASSSGQRASGPPDEDDPFA